MTLYLRYFSRVVVISLFFIANKQRICHRYETKRTGNGKAIHGQEMPPAVSASSRTTVDERHGRDESEAVDFPEEGVRAGPAGEGRCLHLNLGLRAF